MKYSEYSDILLPRVAHHLQSVYHYIYARCPDQSAAPVSADLLGRNTGGSQDTLQLGRASFTPPPRLRFKLGDLNFAGRCV